MVDEHTTLLIADTIIWLNFFNPWLEIVPSIYTIAIITFSHYYRASMKIYDLQAALITINYYRHGKMRIEDIGKLLFDPEIVILIDCEDIS